MKPGRLACALAALALLGPACTAPTPAPPVAPTPAPPAPAPGAERGTPGWEITHPGPEHAIEGYADRTSALPGDIVRLFVSTTAARFTVTAFRMGAYAGSDALRVWQSAPVPGRVQAPAVVQAPTSTVVAPWQPSLEVPTRGWAPGDYLLRLDGDNQAQQYVPLTVRTPSNAGRIVLVNAVTTWQAYNRWGGYSLYDSPSGRKAQRSRAVSFDRPYQARDMRGAGDFLYFELPMARFAESLGLPLGYATDVDLHADPHLLDGARAVIILGHDEYWSSAMRANVTAARDRGVNLAFLGGNEIYRHIRFAPSATGPDRVEIDYKSFGEDPARLTDPLEATPEWRSPPYPRPESVLLGNFYQCNPVHADLVAAAEQNWLLAGIVHTGQHLRGLVGDEYERVDLAVPTPRPIEVLFHSPVTCGGKPDFADTTYYTTSSGAAVFSAGTQYWICGLDPGCPQSGGDAAAGAAIRAITERLLRAYAAGPTGAAHPAADNLAALGIH
ncbi:N,N-dimethylformamidase beta subunit family domain-containing protein [Amycolatopsis tucumanensis]|uniref:N,N-dimethylformamidase beta subunit-like C-terminal domain-containing protein n=1 Tax=Amycolatopsis tucumanensis TaxID=401106 RepID=A0ABP7HEH5_9PSEU|nr:N,N-dimethylformamidase beta subunit family domain-containing protein [Amycolatopsis tucumanensis]MCF6425446.1 hypothetical protein [Amycolatopsis tucumanensis]